MTETDVLSRENLRTPKAAAIAGMLLSLTAAFLALALGALAFRASKRHGYMPFLIGLLAAAGVLLGKFVRESGPMMYGGLGLLVLASLWNSWPRHDAVAENQKCPVP